MRISAHARSIVRVLSSILFSIGLGVVFFIHLATPASAQYPTPSPAVTQQMPYNTTDYRAPNFESDVPRNSSTYTQAVVIDVLSAVMCQLTGINPTSRQQTCLDINPANGKLGYAPTAPAQFGQTQETTPQIGGAIGSMSNYVSVLFVPTVSTSDYGNYLASNFGIVKTANAQELGTDCQNSALGYGVCGLEPIFNLWVIVRDIAYAILVIAFVFLGLGVMLRFKVDPRTVMTLQNQIPRVIIAILLITFSYAIAGIMIDLMWTVTYAGVNAIAGSNDQIRVREGCTGQPSDIARGQSLQDAASANLLDQPISFANRILLKDCTGPIDSGIVNMSSKVSDSFITLVTSIINEFLGVDDNAQCASWTGVDLGACISAITGLIIGIIIAVAILIALFRLWFELIKAYVTFFIFVIMGPVWIVMGLIPGRPLGFEKWLRLIFANLAAFPLVAFMLVFARVLIDSAQPITTEPLTPDTVFIPPLVGNPSADTFSALMAFGVILIAPSIPALIKEKMKVPTSKLGSTAAAGIAAGAGVATAPATKTWKNLNRRNSTTGAPEGALAVWRNRAATRVPGVRSVQNWRRERKKNYNEHGTADTNRQREERRRREGGGS